MSRIYWPNGAWRFRTRPSGSGVGDTIDVLVQSQRDGRAAKRFFRKLLKKEEQSPNLLVTDKLGSYGVAHRELMPEVPRETG